MKQSMNVELMDQEQLYDCLSNVLGGKRSRAKNVSVTRHGEEKAVTYEFAETKASGIGHEWVQNGPQIGERELVTICLPLLSEKEFCHVNHLISKYRGTIIDNRDLTYTATADASAKQVDALICELLPYGMTAMSRTVIEQDIDAPMSLKNEQHENYKALARVIRSGC
ncbi:MAG: hypothetical protein ABF629_05570 [Sporolactobacillus sp.]